MSRRIMGIDEAGRGCVLGPLVVGAFVVHESEHAALRAAGADDSKKLAADRRVEVRERLASMGVEDHVAITATAIDGANLNRLEEAAIVALVRRHRPDHVFIDALGHPRTIPAICARLEAACGVAFTMEPKGDGKWPVVGAASIVAKTTRDAALADCASRHGDLGSGYPSDPKTRAWLLGWARTRKPWPDFVRTRWDTIRQLSQEALF